MPDNIQEQIDEINMKLDRVAEILYTLRMTWAQMIPEPEEEADKETQ
jgi:hypothetical protein